MRIHTYYGANLTPNQNIAGRRWQAYVGGTFVYADTLAGIKHMVRKTLGKA
jgi:hypothetical protein